LRPRVVGGDDQRLDRRIPVGVGPEKDGPISAITKWIPIEVIVFYQGITIPFGNDIAHGIWYAISVGAVVTFLWIAFDIWKVILSWWHPGINPAALAIGAVTLPITDGIMRRLGIPQD
jgi:hypothetical protein